MADAALGPTYLAVYLDPDLAGSFHRLRKTLGIRVASAQKHR